MLDITPADQTPSSPEEAARLDYVGFLHRSPFARDAWDLGFATGRREDYALREFHDGFDIPVCILDNEFRNPDLDRYLDRLTSCNPVPDLAILGDVATASAARDHAAVARDLRDRLGTEPVLVPKSAAALDALDEDLIAGYPIGYSDVVARDYSAPADWAGRRVHILGGTPPRAWRAIQDLSGLDRQTSLTTFDGGTDERATVVGHDYNGLHGIAFRGEHWHRESPHWRPADRLTIRETVRRGLAEIRRFWQERGVWPAATPADHESIRSPTPAAYDETCAGCGSRLEHADAVGYRILEDDDRTGALTGADALAFCSERCRSRLARAGVVA